MRTRALKRPRVPGRSLKVRPGRRMSGFSFTRVFRNLMKGI